MKKTLSVVLLFFVSNLLLGQFVIKQDQISHPITIPISFSGSFGELRSDHFHSGVDLRVQQREGLPILAADDGIVSRIKVSPVGYGNALYISHANGITTVYGHLRNYNDVITEYVTKQQYRRQSFAVDLFPSPFADKISVKKGEIIGYAGNTGSSGGPHLHFEVRNTITERPLNPLLFGVKINDIHYPEIQSFKLYSENKSEVANFPQSDEIFKVIAVSDKKYKLPADTITLSGEYSFGVKAIDRMTSKNDRNGWYKMEVIIDDEPLFEMKMDSFSFDESRYINASIDYYEYEKGNGRYIITKKLPGNVLSIFNTFNGNGIFNFQPNNIYKVEIKISDYSDKTSVLEFWVKGADESVFVSTPNIESTFTNLFSYNQENKFSNDEIEVTIPKGALYQDIYFDHSSTKQNANSFSDVFQIHRPYVPLHKNITIDIKQNNIPDKLKSKAVAVRIDKKNKKSSVGGEFTKNGYFTFTTRSFGNFALEIDTVKPSISNVTGKNAGVLIFKVYDELSGIADYKGVLNGSWALVSWDPKTKTMKYTYDHLVKKGQNEFVLHVTDKVGNKNKLRVVFNN
ncbi:MAG: M23 family metallopeptidase [Lentimicrobiaceae bacterium]|nr:M23 family metallopeptidase [Lentimicrobiaceae bacterium]